MIILMAVCLMTIIFRLVVVKTKTKRGRDSGAESSENL